VTLGSEGGDIFARLKGEDTRERVEAVEEMAAAARVMAERVVSAFARGGAGQHLIAERLGRFGSLVVEPLRDVLAETSDRDTRILAAVSLLYLGERAGVGELLAALNEGDRWAPAAVRALGDNGVVDATPRIEHLAMTADLGAEENAPLVSAIVFALRQLGPGALPSAIRKRLEGVNPAWRASGWLSE
jgi:hypothetical protein